MLSGEGVATKLVPAAVASKAARLRAVARGELPLQGFFQGEASGVDQGALVRAEVALGRLQDVSVWRGGIVEGGEAGGSARRPPWTAAACRTPQPASADWPPSSGAPGAAGARAAGAPAERRR